MGFIFKLTACSVRYICFFRVPQERSDFLTVMLEMIRLHQAHFHDLKSVSFLFFSLMHVGSVVWRVALHLSREKQRGFVACDLRHTRRASQTVCLRAQRWCPV